MGAFSFNGNKIATTGGGGMIVTDDAELARRAKHLTTQAKLPDIGYLHDEVGYNYRLTNLAAALGVAQLARLPEFVQRKAEIAARYDDAFRDVGLVLPPRRDTDRATYWLYSVLMPDGATSACISTRIGRVPSMPANTAVPGALTSRSPRNSSDGLATSRSPLSTISNTPISSVAPNRFFVARRMR